MPKKPQDFELMCELDYAPLGSVEDPATRRLLEMLADGILDEIIRRRKTNHESRNETDTSIVTEATT